MYVAKMLLLLRPRVLHLNLYIYMLSSLVPTRNFEAHGTSKRTELRSALNFEAHGTSKRTEFRNARNFENVFEALMYLIITEPIGAKAGGI